MKKLLYIATAFCLAGISCKDDTVPPSINPSDRLQENIYKRNGDELATSALVEKDSIILSGTFSDAAFAKTDMAFTRVSSAGKGIFSWQLGLPGAQNEALRILSAPTGGYLMLGWSASADQNARAVFVDENGKYVKALISDNGGDESFADGIRLADGSYLLAGTTTGTGRGLRDIYLVKMSAAGTEVWSKTYGTSGNDGTSQLIKTTDGFWIYGYTDGTGAGNRDLWVVKVNENGDSLASYTFGGEKYEQSGGIVATNDGNYLLCGHSTSYGDEMHDAYVVKVSPAGDEIWHKTYGTQEHEGADAIVKLSNGDFGMIGYSKQLNQPDDELYYLQITGAGQLKRELRYGYFSDERGSAIAEVSDGIMLIGYTKPTSVPGKDLYFVKIRK